MMFNEDIESNFACEMVDLTYFKTLPTMQTMKNETGTKEEANDEKQ